ncbi:MAG: hypothetical protein ABW195_11655 [Ilumatobacteraceae bacterium]
MRLAVAGPGSLVGRYPPGNTVGLTEHGPIPADLADLLPAPARDRPPHAGVHLVATTALSGTGSTPSRPWARSPSRTPRTGRHRSRCCGLNRDGCSLSSSGSRTALTWAHGAG